MKCGECLGKYGKPPCARACVLKDAVELLDYRGYYVIGPGIRERMPLSKFLRENVKLSRARGK